MSYDLLNAFLIMLLLGILFLDAVFDGRKLFIFLYGLAFVCWVMALSMRLAA